MYVWGCELRLLQVTQQSLALEPHKLVKFVFIQEYAYFTLNWARRQSKQPVERQRHLQLAFSFVCPKIGQVLHATG